MIPHRSAGVVDLVLSEQPKSLLQVLPQQVYFEWLQHPGCSGGSELPTG